MEDENEVVPDALMTFMAKTGLIEELDRVVLPTQINFPVLLAQLEVLLAKEQGLRADRSPSSALAARQIGDFLNKLWRQSDTMAMMVRLALSRVHGPHARSEAGAFEGGDELHVSDRLGVANSSTSSDMEDRMLPPCNRRLFPPEANDSNQTSIDTDEAHVPWGGGGYSTLGTGEALDECSGSNGGSWTGDAGDRSVGDDASGSDEELTVTSEEDELFQVDEAEEADTTAQQVAAGKDLQGIPWGRLQFTRKHYRETRLKQYRNYTNLLPEDPAEYRDDVLRSCQQPARNARCFDFVRNSRAVHSNIVHFQLRNLLWSVSRNDVFVVYDNTVRHHNPALGSQTNVLDLSGNAAHAGSANTARAPQLGRVQVSTLCVQHGLIAAGGFSGELVIKRLDMPGCLYAERVTNSDNGITNGIEIFESRTQGTCVMTANNDARLRIFTVEPFRPVANLLFPWAVNYATVRPGSSLIAVVGDDPVTHLVDMASGATVCELSGHRDFSFAAAWHPGALLLATGNQDTTTAVWDIRRTKAPLVRLPAHMSAVRTIRFSGDGRFMVFAEPADFVHIYNCQDSLFDKVQEVDLFGEVAGVAFTPDSDALFVAISDITYSSLLQFDRHHERTAGSSGTCAVGKYGDMAWLPHRKEGGGMAMYAEEEHIHLGGGGD